MVTETVTGSKAPGSLRAPDAARLLGRADQHGALGLRRVQRAAQFAHDLVAAAAARAVDVHDLADQRRAVAVAAGGAPGAQRVHARAHQRALDRLRVRAPAAQAARRVWERD